MLTVYSANRDRAIGLPHAGRRTLSLVDYQGKKNIETMLNVISMSFLKSIIDECRADVKQLMQVADTPEKRREILDKVQELHDLASMAAKELEKMTDA